MTFGARMPSRVKQTLRVLWPALIPLALLGIASRVSADFTYDRWDNFEYLRPAITEAHLQWLHGWLPQWNPHTYMGESLMGTMEPGVFYFPYTLCCLLMEVFRLGRPAFPTITVALHTFIAVVGWRLLLGRLGVRPLIALLFGAGYALGGFWTDLSAVWLFVAPQCAWLPWLMYAAIRFMGEGGRWNAALLAALLALEMYIGVPQFAVYAWFFTVMFAAGYGLLVERRRGRMAPLAGVVLVAVMAGGPFLAPAYAYVIETHRSEPLSIAEYLNRGAPPRTALDILLPVYLYQNEFLPGKPSFYLHQGSWVAPPVLAAALLWWRRRRGRREGEKLLWRLFWMALVCAGFFYLLALGSHGHILWLMYYLPFLSSFRWPFRYLPFVLAPLALAGAIGLELCWREERHRKVLWAVSLAVPAAAGALVLENVSARQRLLAVGQGSPIGWNPFTIPGGLWCLIAGLVCMAVVLLGRHTWARIVLLVAAPVELVALVVFCHANLGYKTYREVTVGPRELGMDTRYRLVPLSGFDYAPEIVAGEYASFASATEYGYYSLTGSLTDGLLPRAYIELLPVGVDGVATPIAGGGWLGSSLLRSFNVRYVVVARDDPTRSLLDANPAYRVSRELTRTVVYEDAGAMPRIYFAAKVLRPRTDYMSAVRANLLSGSEPPGTAVVDRPNGQPQQTMSPAEVTWFDWTNSRIRAQVRTSNPAFLVISGMYSPGWQAWADDNPVEVQRVNGTILGMDVPPGTRDIELRFWTPGLTAGLVMWFCAALSVAFWNSLARMARRWRS